mmetsp:Transcript_13671/g.25636  ORF Transcript_13671/g.25636 Transcript_13671/m.25636 type:complete len:220 (-) Transcript_13671:176-835(-)
MGLDPQGLTADYADVEHLDVQQLNKLPPPSSSMETPSLPPGWATAVSPKDGRLYYWEKSTGNTSWTHPAITPTQQQPAVAAPVGVQTANAVPATPPQQRQVLTSISLDSDAESGIMASRTMKTNASVENPINGSRRPNTHQGYATLATILFFPIGLFALVNALKVDQAWDSGRYGSAIKHSRASILYSRIACGTGAVFWIYFLFFRGPGGIFDFPPLFA